MVPGKNMGGHFGDAEMGDTDAIQVTIDDVI